MSDEDTPIVVSLDTSVFVGLNFGFVGRVLQRLAELQADGLIEIVMPDVLVREVKRRVSRAIDEARQKHQEHQKSFRIFGHDDELKQKLRSDDFYFGLQSKIHAEFDSFVLTVNATIVDTNQILPSVVFDLYFSVAPPFGKKGKEKEFPDAFALAALVHHSEQIGTKILVVSEDNDYRKACENKDELEWRKSVNLVINEVMRQSGEYAVDQCHNWVHENQDALADRIREHIKTLTFDFRTTHGWIEKVSVDTVELDDVAVLRIDDDVVEMSATVSAYVDFEVDYYVEGGSYYDSEDRLVIPQENVQRVLGQYLEFSIGFSLKIDLGAPKEISEVTPQITDEVVLLSTTDDAVINIGGQS